MLFQSLRRLERLIHEDSFFAKLKVIVINRIDVYFDVDPSILEYVFWRLRELGKCYNLSVLYTMGKLILFGLQYKRLHYFFNDIFF